MRHVGLRSIAVVAFGAMVLAGLLWIASNVDARPPEVAGFRLTQALSGDPQTALITTSVEVDFTEPVDEPSAAAALQFDPEIEGSVSWSGSTLTFTPAEALPLETEFVVRVGAGVRDRAGNVMDADSTPFAFQTAGRPTIAETDPVDERVEVPLDGPITLVFSTLMDTASVEAQLRVRPAFAHDLRWSREQLEIVPNAPLRPGQRYVVSIDGRAADIAGVELGNDFSLAFEKVATELEPATIIPADGSDGIAVTTPVAIVFDTPLDAGSISADDLTITPNVAGSFDIVSAAGEDEAEARIVRFVPSSPLPDNTTFSVELAPGLRAVDGAQMAASVEWTFTTGSPSATLGNQVVFLSDRSGSTNLWAMNQDGTGQRQVSAELSPIHDFAVAPDGRSYVVGDGRALILQQADGSGRRVLTDASVMEFDPAYSPDGRRIAFARVDAGSGAGLGLWERAADGGDDRRLVLPREVGASTPPSPTDGEGEPPAELLRAPRYAPDGQALAFVDATGRIGIVELPAERVTTSEFVAAGAPSWLPDSSGVLIAGSVSDGLEPRPNVEPGDPVAPLDPLLPGEGPPGVQDIAIAFFARSGPDVEATTLGARAASVAVDASGRIVVISVEETDAELRAGRLRVAIGIRGVPRLVDATRQRLVRAASFGPEPAELVLELVDDDSSSAGVWRLGLESGELERLSIDGQRPRWLP